MVRSRTSVWVSPTRSLAVVYGSGAGLCALAAVRPVSEHSSLATALTGVVVGGAGAAVLWCWRSRPGPAAASGPVVHGGLALLWLMVALFAVQSVTAVGVIGLGPSLVGVGMYAAYFLSRRAAALHVGLALVAYALGAWACGVAPLVPVVVNVVAVGVVSRLQSALVDQLRAGALTDPLTGLGNRQGWERSSADAVARARRDGSALCVALLDLDDFKAVNDQHGHAAGDRLLRELAAAWTGLLRPGDHLARVGGDEFVLLLPGTDETTAADVVARLVGAHAASWSFGLARWRAGETVDEVLHRADVALYAHKARRRPGAVGPRRTPASLDRLDA